MKRKLIVSSLALLLALVLVGAALAQPPGGPPRPPGPSPEQVAQAFDLRQDFLKDTAALRKQMWVKRAEMAALWRAEKPDAKQILAKQKEINALRDQLQEKALALKLKMPWVGPLGMRGPCMGPGMGKGMGMHPGRHGCPMFPGLTPEQAGQAFDLAQQFRGETAGLRKQMAVKRAELGALWRADKPDEKLILAKKKELNALRDQLQEKAVPFRLKMRQICPKGGHMRAECPIPGPLAEDADPAMELALGPAEDMME